MKDFSLYLQHILATIGSETVNPDIPRSRTMTVDQRKITRIQDEIIRSYSGLLKIIVKEFVNIKHSPQSLKLLIANLSTTTSRLSK